jgi:ABC-type branched-subunit amino acid transport system substrate-binding protein
MPAAASTSRTPSTADPRVAIRAALTLGLSGPFARQGAEAAEGVRLWAEEAGARLTVVDDGGSGRSALEAYRAWLGEVDLLLGPYGSGLVRAVAPLVCGARRLLWNHGGAADDLARPGLVSLAAPASSYFHGAVDEAVARGAGPLLVARGRGPFAAAVAEGAAARAARHGIDARTVGIAELAAGEAAGAAVLVAARFDEDVAAVRGLRRSRPGPALLAAVAAGLPAFGEALGRAADGVLGPVQWWPSPRAPRVGPSGAEFAARFRRRTGRQPSYVAAQAAAAGYLAGAAGGRDAEAVRQWTTSTLLGAFALDAGWRQVGHRVRTVRWRAGRMVPLTGGQQGKTGAQ